MAAAARLSCRAFAGVGAKPASVSKRTATCAVGSGRAWFSLDRYATAHLQSPRRFHCPPQIGTRSTRGRASGAARDEVPEELEEEDNFVPLREDDPRFGPPALLLLGFRQDKAERVRSMLKDMDGDFMQIVLCTPQMLKWTLREAVSAKQPNFSEVEIAEGLPGLCFLSGLTGEETLMMIQEFRDAGMEDTVFAAHVPLNTEKPIERLVDEIMGDHERLTRQREQARA